MYGFRQKPVLPVGLNIKSSLYNGLTHAPMCAAMGRDFGAGVNVKMQYNNPIKYRGFPVTTIQAKKHYQYSKAGMAFKSQNGGNTQIGGIKFSNINGKFDPGGDPANARFTIFALCEPLQVQSFKIRQAMGNRTNAGISPGYGIQDRNFLAHTWRFELGDGAKRFSLDLVRGIPTIGRMDSIVCTFDGARMVAYFDGKFDSFLDVFPDMPTLSPAPDMVLGSWSGVGDTFEGFTAVNMAWNRVLTRDEIARLYVDPYELFRGEPHSEFMFGAGSAPSANFDGFFLSF